MRNGAHCTKYVADPVTRPVWDSTKSATSQPYGLLIQIDRLDLPESYSPPVRTG